MSVGDWKWTSDSVERYDDRTPASQGSSCMVELCTSACRVEGVKRGGGDPECDGRSTLEPGEYTVL